MEIFYELYLKFHDDQMQMLQVPFIIILLHSTIKQFLHRLLLQALHLQELQLYIQ